MPDESRLVWSSHPPSTRPAAEPPAGSGQALPPFGQKIKVRREKQGRAGKTVTTLFEFQASDRQREALCKELKKGLGCGGTVKANVVEIQGDQLEKIMARLVTLGYKPLQAGG